MSPILKIDPNTGESLDKNKTAEQILAESSKPKRIRKPRAPKTVLQPQEEIPVKVNPFLAPNREIVVEELLEPLNAILEESEAFLKEFGEVYNLKNDKLDLSSKVRLPSEFEYKSSVTRVNNGADGFLLVKPSGITRLQYNDLNKDVYIDRIMLDPLDVKELLKYPEKAKSIFKALIVKMFNNLSETKQLNTYKKYFGTTVASIKLPGLNQYCLNHRDEYIEIRLFSDITELPEGE